MTVGARIVVFTGDLNYSVRRGIVEIDRHLPDLSWLVVVHAPPRTPAALARNQWRNLRRNGWRWIPYQISDLWHRVLDREPARTPGSPGDEFTLAALESRAGTRIETVADLHSSTLDLVREFEPDLGISLAAPILKAPLFSIPRLGTLNLHKGKVPAYRGMPPAFWELWNEERSIGCTVHRVDEKLDTGDIVREATVARQRYSTLRGLRLCLDELGVTLMREAVADVLGGTGNSVPQPAGGKTYRKPTLAQVAALERRMRRAEPPTGAVARNLLKEFVLAGAISLWFLLLRRLVAPRVVVLLYHRVSDDARDNLTAGIEQFDRQMAMLREHCHVVSIEELLAYPSIPRSARPLVCVTFDDGYLDNYLYAIPSLLRHGLPASFFVATGIVGTDRAFPHDQQRGNPHLPMMSWDQLREMRERGFTIGSHSVSHIDCAAEPEELVRAELSQSLADLKRELSLQDVMFAYPYGGRRHMTPERLALVKQAGYAACLSAYGGVNVREVDRFNVLRGGIHAGFSDRAFLFRCLGLV